MITREEAEKMVDEICDYPDRDHKSKAHRIVSKIYDSIGTCNVCCLRGEQECPMVSYYPDLGWIDDSAYDGYCYKFLFQRKDEQ
jgi:hypothetical protein